MTSIYTVDKKHFKYYALTPNDQDSDTNRFDMKQRLFGKWIKADTTDSDINVFLPDYLYNGFSCIIENTGQNKVNYIVPNNLVLRTDEENYTDTRYRSVEVNFDKESKEWRIQGYIGIDDINSIYDVKTNQDGVPKTGDVLTFDETTGFWKASFNPPFLNKRNEVVTDAITIDNKDHEEFIVIDTKSNPVDVAIPLGLKEGLHLKLLNISDGSLNLNVAGTLIGPNSTSKKQSYIEVHHLKDDVYYSTIVGGLS